MKEPRPHPAAATSDETNWVQGELRLLSGLDGKLFDLLAAIAATGSLNQAAQRVGLSYRGAWQLLERANNLAPRPLVTTATGGRHGGGTTLTASGEALLALFQALRAEHGAFIAAVNRRLAADPFLRQLFRRLLMKASARNQLTGTVSDIARGGVNAEITVRLKGGQNLVATVTRAAVDTLGLGVGREVVALIKAPQVLIVTEWGGYRLSARNQLTGTVDRLHRGAVTTEVVVGLGGGDSIAATVTNDSADALGLAQGAAATAVFKAGAVILGVAD